MSGPTTFPSVHLADDAATTALGQRLAPLLAAGDVILLDGDLGTGKTHMARAIIQARQTAAGKSVEHVPSPTYTLIQIYDVGGAEIWHTDLYRLSGPDEVPELGLEDAFQDAIVLVEWPERLGDAAPTSALRVCLSHAPDGGRDARFDGPSAWLRRLSDAKVAE